MPRLALLLALGCTASNHPEAALPAPEASAPASWAEVLAGPAVLEHEEVVSARWEADRSGMINLRHPDAAHLPDEKVPALLLVHVLRHPEVTTEGPALFVGDTSHTWWGWDHGVEPGTFTVDHDRNAESLAALRALVEAHPEIQVHVGHERARHRRSDLP